MAWEASFYLSEAVKMTEITCWTQYTDGHAFLADNAFRECIDTLVFWNSKEISIRVNYISMWGFLYSWIKQMFLTS